MAIHSSRHIEARQACEGGRNPGDHRRPLGPRDGLLGHGSVPIEPDDDRGLRSSKVLTLWPRMVIKVEKTFFAECIFGEEPRLMQNWSPRPQTRGMSKASKQAQWEDLILPEDHPFTDAKGVRLEQVARQQVNA